MNAKKTSGILLDSLPDSEPFDIETPVETIQAYPLIIAPLQKEAVLIIK
jgi:hypothetical protein